MKNYATFSGRARRKEYWMFILFNMIFGIVAMIVDNVIGTTIKMDVAGQSVSLGYGYIYIVYMLAVLIPGLAVAIRRLHDVNKSGWFCFISLIPLVGGIWLLVLMCSEGTRGENRFGPDPKG